MRYQTTTKEGRTNRSDFLLPTRFSRCRSAGLANNLWRHGGPTAAFVHLCTAMCFLLPSLLMEARLIHAGFLPKGNDQHLSARASPLYNHRDLCYKWFQFSLTTRLIFFLLFLVNSFFFLLFFVSSTILEHVSFLKFLLFFF